ncbi:MAG: hypothetical protein M3Z25_10500 [Actinomycetota bacterium]|nr:hypothetical protein [Actinomycetota bacterium]
MSESLLTAGYIVWTLVTLGAYLAYRFTGYTQRAAWRRVAQERRKQQHAWRLLIECGADKQYHDTLAYLGEYLEPGSEHYGNLEDDEDAPMDVKRRVQDCLP